MDTTDLQIVFDEDGFCNHCTEFLTVRAKYMYQGKETDEARGRVVEAIKRAGRNSEYECIIGVSGGVDSSYVAYLVKELGLRPLAVHLDNGWDSEEAVQNVRNVISKLKIDYESYVLDWEEFKDIQLAFLKASVPEAETPTDVAIPVALHHFAAKHNVKYIVSGGNLATEGIMPKSWHYNAKDLTYYGHIKSTFGTRKVTKFKTFGYLTEIYFKLVKGIRIIYLLNYLPFDNQEVISILKDTLEWKEYGQKHFESRYTRFIQSYYLYEKFGIDYRRATFSCEICDGKMSREEALEQLKSKPYDEDQIEDDKQYVAKKLEISLDELEEILGRRAKWFWDYPNDNRKLTLIYNAYRKLFNTEKLSSS